MSETARGQIFDTEPARATPDGSSRPQGIPSGDEGRPAESPHPSLRSGGSGPGVTILFGGFTDHHHRLLQGVWKALGYQAEPLPTPDFEALGVGRELGNPSQCNPTYFTVGNLVRHLRQLERDGMPRDEIIERFVFVTAGACGPCRFGMYESEYRLALRNAGFEGFRVLLFQQKAGLSQGVGEAGIRYDEDFFLGLLITMAVADQLKDLANQIRPFERVQGTTDRVLDDSVEALARFFAEDEPFRGIHSVLSRLRQFVGRNPPARGRLGWWRLMGLRRIARRLEQVAESFRRIEVDYLQVRPVVKITGEFWAQITEGDGNFHMFRFLESEGAQVRVEPVSAWITYLLHQARQRQRDRLWLPARPELDRLVGSRPGPGMLRRTATAYWRLMVLGAADVLFRAQWRRFRRALGGVPHALVDQNELARLGHPYYNTRCRGGEGHLEVAENIYFHSRGLAHMVLSVKPFGCMPSGQSDGVQSAVVNHHPGMVFLPIETSSEGQIHAHSRVQLALSEAREKAEDEYRAALARSRHSEEEIRAFAARRPALHHALLVLSSDGGAGTAARFVRYVDGLMQAQSGARASLERRATVVGGGE